MFNETKVREGILDELYDTYLKFSGNFDMQNKLVRDMIHHCNWLHKSIGEFLISKAAQEPAPQAFKAATTAIEGSLKADFPYQCPHCERSFKSEQGLYGHQSKHPKSKLKTVNKG